jgi:signal transduction histidine kinase
MPEGGEIVLAAREQNANLILQVIDQGGGIKPDDLDKIYDPFFTTKETGTGLGLAVAYQIVTQLGGTLTHDRNDDKGMTFSITLPRQTEMDK